MKTLFKSFSMLAVAACAGMSITSCTADKDLYSPEVAEQNLVDQYTTNFVKKYGVISQDMTWDFTGPTEYILPGTKPATKSTRVARPIVSKSQDYYEVDQKTLNWMNNKLKESTNNSSLGEPFVLNMPNNSFSIVPIYVGQAGLTWDFHMVTVGEDGTTEDVLIWQKGQDVQKKASATSNWTTLGTGSGDNTLNAAAVRAKEFTILGGSNGVPENTTFYFYLEVTNNDNSYAYKGTKQSSIKHMMLALDVPAEAHPTNIPAEDELMIIGCEDADLSKSDWDYNDVVFLLHGHPEKPRPEKVTEVEEVKDVRYMIEDLGSTDDFDFNDIVIDARVARTIKYHYDQDGKLTNTEYGPWGQQTATLKHLGGTLPYTVSIGSTTLPWQTPELNVDKNETVKISGWDYNRHNIVVTVKDKTNDTVHKIQFPKAGEAPMIIAVPVSTEWMGERTSVPSDWFYVPAE